MPLIHLYDNELGNKQKSGKFLRINPAVLQVKAVRHKNSPDIRRVSVILTVIIQTHENSGGIIQRTSHEIPKSKSYTIT